MRNLHHTKSKVRARVTSSPLRSTNLSPDKQSAIVNFRHPIYLLSEPTSPIPKRTFYLVAFERARHSAFLSPTSAYNVPRSFGARLLSLLPFVAYPTYLSVYMRTLCVHGGYDCVMVRSTVSDDFARCRAHRTSAQHVAQTERTTRN